MDNVRAAERVMELAELVREHDELRIRYAVSPRDAPARMDELTSKINALRPLIERIADAVGSEHRHAIDEGFRISVLSPVAPLERLAGAIATEQEAEEIIGPQGPKLAAASLHEWVWDHAASLWSAGHRREAVRAAGVAIFESHLPAAVGLSKDVGTEALCSVFKTDSPAPGRPRLRIRGYSEGTDDFSNAQQGAQNLGLACAKLVRNLSVHSSDEPDEQEALEELAMLSRFARLVDGSDVVTDP